VSELSLATSTLLTQTLTYHLLSGIVGLYLTLAPGGLFFYFFRRFGNSEKFRKSFEYADSRIMFVMFLTLAHLPARWIVGQLGPYYVNFVFLLASPLCVYAWLLAVGSVKNLFIDISIIGIFFIVLSLINYGAWLTPFDVVMNESNTIYYPNQSDLPPHYALQQILAYSRDAGIYWSPLGFPDKITQGSYGASQFAAIFAFNASTGNKSLWAISQARLGIFFYFYLACLSTFLCSRFLIRSIWHPYKPNIYAGVCASVIPTILFHQLILSTHGNSQALTEIFIHSINNGAGIAAFFLTFVVCLNFSSTVIHSEENNSLLLFMALFLGFAVLIFHRANWVFFYVGFLGTIFFAELKKRISWNKNFKIFGFRASNFNSSANSDVALTFCIILYSALFIYLFFKTNLFGFPLNKIGFNTRIDSAAMSWLHYYEWYPELHSLFLSWLKKINNAFGKLWIECTIELFIAIVIFIGTIAASIDKTLARATLFGTITLAASRFLVAPIQDGYYFGSTEPLGNSHLLIRFIIFFVLSVWASSLFRKKAGVVFTIVGSIYVLLTFPTGRDLYPGFIQITRSSPFLKAREICQKGKTKALWTDNQETASISGCLVTGEFRYSKKLSSGNSRLALVELAQTECLHQASSTLLAIDENVLALCGK